MAFPGFIYIRRWSKIKALLIALLYRFNLSIRSRSRAVSAYTKQWMPSITSSIRWESSPRTASASWSAATSPIVKVFSSPSLSLTSCVSPKICEFLVIDCSVYCRIHQGRFPHSHRFRGYGLRRVFRQADLHPYQQHYCWIWIGILLILYYAG